MSQRLNGGRLIAAAGGVLLVVSLFGDWYDPGLSAWDTFELADLVLAATGIAAAASIVRPLLGQPTGDPDRAGRMLFYLAIGALIIIVAGLIQPPPAALESSPQVGAWLGLVGAALVAGGALLSTSRVSIVISFDRRESVTPSEGGEVVPPPPGTDPAPPDSETSAFPAQRN